MYIFQDIHIITMCTAVFSMLTWSVCKPVSKMMLEPKKLSKICLNHVNIPIKPHRAV